MRIQHAAGRGLQVVLSAGLIFLSANACMSRPAAGVDVAGGSQVVTRNAGPTPTDPPPAPTLPPEASRTATPFPRIPVDLPLSDVAYALPLTLRHVTQDTVTLLFELQAPTPGKVLLQPEDGSALPIEFELDPGQVRWLRTIDGLAPSTRYRVVVALKADGQELAQPRFRSATWGPVVFRTTPDQRPPRFGVISDASFGDPATFELVQRMATSDLDFVLHAGDVVDETEDGRDPFDSYAERFYAPFEPLLAQMPVYTVPGNHDYDADIRYGEGPFYYYAFPAFVDPDIPGPVQTERNQFYAFGRGDLQFILLDTQTLFGIPGRDEQQRWMEDRLDDPSYRATIVVQHVAPFSSSTVHPSDSLPPRLQWVSMFEQARVPLVFSGHFHNYERLIANGITFVVAGGGSSILYPMGDALPQSQVFERKTHFVLVEAGDEGLRLTAHGLGGEVLDQVEIALPFPSD